MRRSGRFLVLALFLAIGWSVSPAKAFAQSVTGTEEPSDSAVGGATENVSGETSLPEDFPTRETFEGTRAESPQLGPTAADYFRVVVGLVVVIAVVWGLSLVLKRFVTVRGLAGSSESLKVLFTLSLSPTRTLYLVRLADRVLLIGAGEGGLRTLAEITEPGEVSAVLRDLEFKGNYDLNPFRERLNALLNEGGKGGAADDDLDIRQHKLKGVLDRLKDIESEERE